jgi:2-polyprenyl-6-methoxyphenol hydroxylase-like FAD-dependent oxidoreductase
MKILISGGGIAGLTAGLLLHKDGHEIKIIDKARSFQKSGYGLSLKSFGIKIMNELGLLDELQKHALPINSFNIYRSNGKLIRRLSKETVDAITGGAIPIARADLHSVLFDAIKNIIPVRFNFHILSITHLPEKELILFSNGTSEEFDLVIVAEGLRSSTRRLLWEDKGWIPFDATYVAAIINQKHHFDLGHAYTFRGVGKTIAFFPITKEQVAIQAYFRSESWQTVQRDSTKTLLLKIFSEFSPDIILLLREIDDKNYVFYDTIAMIELSSYATKHVVLLGDAAYCPTFLSGMGASLSLLGAKVLNESLKSSANIKDALSRYNNIMFQLAQHFQKNARSNMKRELPQSKIQAAISNFIISAIPLSIMKKRVGKQLMVEKQLAGNIIRHN